MHRAIRRAGVTPGMAQGNSIQAFAIIGAMLPGAGVGPGISVGDGVAVFADRHGSATGELFFGNEFASSQEIYDPYYMCCAFGAEDVEDEVVADVIHAAYNQYARRYEVCYPFGLTRRMQLSGNLTMGSNTTASIIVTSPDGSALAGASGVTVYHWQTIGDDIASGTAVMGFYETAARRWYTNAYRDAT